MMDSTLIFMPKILTLSTLLVFSSYKLFEFFVYLRNRNSLHLKGQLHRRERACDYLLIYAVRLRGHGKHIPKKISEEEML
jgi:hypothetical protein